MTSGRGVPPTTASVLAAARTQPLRIEKEPPCSAACASGTDVRGWIGLVAQRKRLGLSDEEALDRAWEMVTAVNPFPAVTGRICPHPCQTSCSRAPKDGPVAIKALERFLGDWGLARGLALPRLEAPDSRAKSIGVIGSGPAGLSFAYQMSRRGYPVTVYERQARPGGMLYYGIPQYRLPESVLEAEVARILDLGVELRLGAAVGHDVDLATLRSRHDVLFLGVGAGRGLRLGIPGEAGPGVWTGVDYLALLNRGATVALGREVVVVGGGNTAVDAARAARRSGAEVTLLYRRTRAEMPAIEAEVDDALAEGVRMEFLAAPVRVVRDGDDAVRAVVVQRMELGASDDSGRRRPVPIAGADRLLRASALIAAVSQQPDWDGLEELAPAAVWAKPGVAGALGQDLWTGGDTSGLGIAGRAIAEGRQAAEAVHAKLQSLGPAEPVTRPSLPPRATKPDYYPGRAPVTPPRAAPDLWRVHPDAEVGGTIGKEAFLAEAARCFSCGLCYGCEQCFMYCSAGAFTRLDEVSPGAYLALSLDRCQACGQCIDLCPCGFLSPTSPDAIAPGPG